MKAGKHPKPYGYSRVTGLEQNVQPGSVRGVLEEKKIRKKD